MDAITEVCQNKWRRHGRNQWLMNEAHRVIWTSCSRIKVHLSVKNHTWQAIRSYLIPPCTVSSRVSSTYAHKRGSRCQEAQLGWSWSLKLGNQMATWSRKLDTWGLHCQLGSPRAYQADPMTTYLAAAESGHPWSEGEAVRSLHWQGEKQMKFRIKEILSSVCVWLRNVFL